MPAPEARVAVAQYAPRLGDSAANLAASLERIEAAAAAGANLLVLPECCTTGYTFDDRAALLALAETVPGPTTGRWCAEARRHGLHLVAGIVERDGDTLYNSAVVIAPEGLVARYRKIHLWGIERELYRAGDEPVVAPTPWGGLGVLVCYDLWFPELVRSLVLAGAAMLAVPANWAGNPRMRDPLDGHGLPMGYHMAVAAACANERPLLVADRTGAEGPFRFLGHSCIVGATGEVLAGPLGVGEQGLLSADLVPAAAASSAFQSHLRSRRPEVYRQCPAVENTS